MARIANVIAYWRACLADTARLNIDPKRLERAFTVSREAVKVGRITTTVASEVVKAFWGDKGSPQGKDPQEILHDEDTLARVLICPIVARPRTNHTVHTAGNDTALTPVWIPAQLSQDGALSPADNQLPWIPRNLLEPVLQAAETIGDMETLDRFLTLHPGLQNKENPDQPPRWIDVWQYSNNMLQAVAQQTLDHFALEGYDTAQEAHIVPDVDIRSSARDVIRLYDAILRRLEDKTAAPPRLLPRLTNWHEAPPSPLLNEQQSMAKSAEHLGQMRQDYPLSPSQREAVHHFLTLADGEILAINGPPGTGKTTLLQSIVASLWVQAALHDHSEPPIMFAASMNNQAITNIIDSFGNVPGDGKPLGGRWLPGINSYALYCPAPSRRDTAQQKQYQMTSLPGGFYVPPLPKAESNPLDYWNIESEAFVSAAEQYFLHRCRQYAERDVPDVQAAVTLLQRQLVEIISAIRQGVQTWLQMKQVQDELSGLYEAHGGVETYLDQLTHALTTCRQQVVEAKRAQGGWLEHLDAAPWWMTLLKRLPSVKHRISIRNRRYCASLPFDVVADVSNTKGIMDFFDRLVQEPQSEEQRLAEALRQVEHDQARWQSLQQAWHTWCTQHAVPPDLPSVWERMDRQRRYTAFQLATHYWEGRWLLEMREQFNTDYKERQSEAKQKKRWRRYAKLTPCFVSTLHMTPAFLNAHEGQLIPLFDFVDLLILDEAGQVAPDIGGATFALAKKALVVGDTHQLEPVWNLTTSIDIGNMQEKHVVTANDAVDLFFSTGLSASSGSLMKVAQRASKYQKSDERGLFERGMFLAEHRRCVPEIIQYCNNLAYQGRLVPMRARLVDYPLPHLGYAHIPGQSRQMAGSRDNAEEAHVIAQWIVEHRDTLTSQYPGKNLEHIIAIITPFKRQASLLKRMLKEHGITEPIEVGTVHVLQGAERPIVLFSSVYGMHDSPPFFFDRSNMLNVAVSRAQDSFLVFGNMNNFHRQDSGVASGALARFLFADAGNEITDISLPVRRDVTLSATHPHLDTLEAHRTALTDGLRSAQHAVWIVSPYISAHAIDADSLPSLIQDTVKRGVIVTVYFDPQLNSDEHGVKKPIAVRGIRMLRAGGAHVKEVRSEHSKTLMIDHTVLIEGSFNWLSASRDDQSRYHRRERSLRYEGQDVGEVIAKIIRETEGRVLVSAVSAHTHHEAEEH
jgi:hypothetical protein